MNEPPTGPALSGNNILEQSSNGSVVGDLSSTDPDAGETHTYWMLDDAAGRFAASGNQLIVANGSLLDTATNPSHVIRILTTDAGGLGFEKLLTIYVLPTSATTYYISTTSSGTVTNNNGTSLIFKDEDIIRLTVQGNGQYQFDMYFDGSDVGLTLSEEDIDAFDIQPDGPGRRLVGVHADFNWRHNGRNMVSLF